jgi:protein associated with RNAse G/E
VRKLKLLDIHEYEEINKNMISQRNTEILLRQQMGAQQNKLKKKMLKMQSELMSRKVLKLNE